MEKVKWSRKYNKCIICRTTERKHNGDGMCTKCYQQNYVKLNSEKVKETNKKWREKNHERHKENYRKWAKINPKKVKERSEKWQKENPEKVRESNKKYYKKNLEKIKERRKRYCRINRKEITKREKRWKKNNPEKVKKYFKEYITKRRKIDPHFKLRINISSLIRIRLKQRLSSKNNKSTFSFLPYTVKELKQHLEKQFTGKMDWNNYGKWHIDHKTPDSNFNYVSVNDKEFQECWALKNLQPLWAKDNLKKGGKLRIF